jgi:hypothetical protein
MRLTFIITSTKTKSLFQLFHSLLRMYSENPIFNKIYIINFGIAQSIQELDCRLDDSSHGKEMFFFSTESRVQPSMQWVPGLFPWEKVAGA